MNLKRQIQTHLFPAPSHYLTKAKTKIEMSTGAQ